MNFGQLKFPNFFARRKNSIGTINDATQVKRWQLNWNGCANSVESKIHFDVV